jgi:hypothetical protein
MEVYLDFEFNQTTERRLNVLCAAWEVWEKKQRISSHSVWFENEGDKKEFRIEMEALRDKGATFIAYAVVAEAGSFYSLGIHPFKGIKWIDLYLEYRMLLNHNHTYAYGHVLCNGKPRFTEPPKPKWERTKEDDGKSAPPEYGLAASCYKMLNVEVDTDHKTEMRDLIIAGGPFSDEDKTAILDYCESDVRYLSKLYFTISQSIKEGGLTPDDQMDYKTDALRRGDYAARTAYMERVGRPINYEGAKNFGSHVGTILYEVAKEITELFPDIRPFIFNARKGVFQKKEKNIRRWILEKHSIPGGKIDWDETDTGKASLSLEAFEKHYPYKENFPEDSFGAQMVRFLRTQKAMNGFLPPKGKKRTFWDSVGSDGWVRPYMGIYGAQSARSQPSATGFIPLKAKWMRVLLQPPERLCYISIDYSSQEFLLGALLSNDTNMIEAYHSGDPYMHTAILAGAAPQGATKDSHKLIREKFKSTVLGISYLMGPVGLAKKLSQDTGLPHDEDDAQELINLFQNTYQTYDKWRHQVYKDYQDRGYLKLPCGWIMFGDNPNRRSVSNCPVQGAGSSGMREAVRRAQDMHLHVAFTLHDELCVLAKVKDVVRATDALADAMDQGFRHYFPTHSKRDTGCRLSAKIWSPAFKEGQQIETRWFPKQKLMSQCVNEKFSPDYAKYKKYFTYEDEAIALNEVLNM